MTNSAVQIRLELENKQLTAQLRKVQNDFARTKSKVSSDAESMGRAVGLAFRSFILPAGVVAGIVGFTNAIVNTSKAVADLNDQAQSLGIGFEQFQVLRYTASQTGTDIDKVSQSIAKMQVAIGNATMGKDNVFTKLNISLYELKQLNPEQQFQRIAEALNGIADPTEKAAAAAAIFGRGFRELIPLLAEYAKGLDSVTAAAKAQGVIIDDVTKQKLAAFDDTWEKLTIKTQVLKANFFSPLAQYFTEILDPALNTNLSYWQRLTQAMEQTFIIGEKVKTIEPPSLNNEQFDDLLNKSRVKFDWSNFLPKPPPEAVKKAEAAGTTLGKAAAESFLKPMKRAIVEVSEETKSWLAALDASDAAASEGIADSIAKLEEANTVIPDFNKNLEQNAAIWGSISLAATDALIGIATNSESAGDALRDLLKLLLKAIAQAAILAAFGQGSFKSNLSGFFGGPTGFSDAGGARGITVYNYSSTPGGVQARTNSNGGVDIFIGQVANAISRGGNALDQTLRRTYGLGRIGA